MFVILIDSDLIVTYCNFMQFQGILKAISWNNHVSHRQYVRISQHFGTSALVSSNLAATTLVLVGIERWKQMEGHCFGMHLASRHVFDIFYLPSGND